MKKILVVDDMQVRHDAVNKLHPYTEIHSHYTCESACEALALRGVDYFDIIYLDHDAGGATFVEHGKGSTFYPVACLLVAVYSISKEWDDAENQGPYEDFPEVRIISANRPAAEKMLSLMENAGLNVKIFDLYDKVYIIGESND